jgi:hypothetical protein
MTHEELYAQWTAQCDTFRRIGALVDGSKIVAQFLADLAIVERAEEDVVLTLRQAAALSGYSIEHLARLIRQGRIPNAGRRCAPRLRKGDLPIRRQFARTRPGSYDVMTDARSLRTQR